MKLDQGKLAQGLFDEIMTLVHKYDKSLYVPTVLGCLELVKQQVISDSINNEENKE
jgi:hypothetical protein